ncbi:GGDEF domain-containing protein [Halobacillus locisalis]|uniref:GGDEF domain-containing protein n=1 Tax=Halobacillus locisalis TaxID=220753 RepID=A0A838CMC4_9BACI|nr:diguanylate cyclase [Halobacillus locisalis]MBA2173317.1 GGDEF domain-containing protein [Halobacillus locisalis]
MQLYSKETIQHLQARVFELFTTESTHTFEKFIDLLSIEIQQFLQIDGCVIYLLNEWEEVFQLRAGDSYEGLTLHDHVSATDISWEESTLWYKNEPFNPYKKTSIPYVKSSSIPLMDKEKIYGFLLLSQQVLGEFDHHLLNSIIEEVSKAIHKIRVLYSAFEEKRKYESLYKGTSLFHSSNKSDEVLEKVIETLRNVYPQFNYYLLLSQDYAPSSELPIKNLSYEKDNASQASTQAYLLGEMQMEYQTQEGQSILYAPLKGKQGVYGVLQVVSDHALYFPETYVEFFDLLSQDAGKALENAQLYQQSRRLNSDLQLINSTSKHLNSTMRLTEKITYMADRIDQSFQADEVGFIIFEDDTHSDFTISEGSSAFFNIKDSRTFIERIDRTFMREEEAVFIGDLSSKWEGHCPFRSLMAVPMKDQEYLDGLAIVVHRDPYYFSFESFKLLQSLVHHSTLAFANSMLHEELERTIITDYLTKLHSRNYLDQQVEEHLKQDENGHFLLFDIDNFKRVNDTHGHQVGDAVICQVADIIQTIIANQGLAARWGGEELAVYLPSMSFEEAHALAELVRNSVSEQSCPPVTVSCGLASWDSVHLLDVKQMVKQADQALYVAKEFGKNRIVKA